MCVDFTKDKDEFPPSRSDEALEAMVPGSAVSFNRISLYHFAIFLGWAWPKGSQGEADRIPLLCHFSGDAEGSKRGIKTSVRLDDVRNIVQGSTVRVHGCSCRAEKRARVINECLRRVGETGIDHAASNNSEHFVRRVINGEDVGYQTILTLVASYVPVPLELNAEGPFSSSSSVSASSYYSMDSTTLGLIDPEMNLVIIELTKNKQGVNSIVFNPCCTREFLGSSFTEQEFFCCRTCHIARPDVVCKPCEILCHKSCSTWDHHITQGFCDCAHEADESVRFS